MDAPAQQQDGGQAPPPGPEARQVGQIQQLLKAKDDTSRFVGLALLKSTLDDSAELRGNQEVVASLWESISPKFLDRLLKTGSRPGAKDKDAKEMLDLAANVLYTFTILLPEELISETRLIGRIPRLVEAVLQSSEETTDSILKTLFTLVSHAEGGRVFAKAEDWTPLVEIAPKHEYVLAIFSWSWLHASTSPDPRPGLRDRIDNTIGALVASFKGTDAVTLLRFLDKALGRLDDELLPEKPAWLAGVTDLIRNLATTKPTAAGREAYTNCAARLLLTYPGSVPGLLFGDSANSSTPFSYLFVNLVVIDLRSSLPSLLAKLNTPEYPAISARLSSALFILASFVVFLVQQMDAQMDEDGPASTFTSTFHMEPDLMLKLNRSIGETLSVVMEYLRDRWDAAVAGVQGLHPEARQGVSHTTSGSHLTLAWDAQNEPASEDPLLLAALRVLGVWLREDDGEGLRREAISLMDMMMELYQEHGGPTGTLGYRAFVIGVLQGVTQIDDGIQALLDHGGWSALSKDLLTIFRQTSASQPDTQHCELGSQLALLLLALAESQHYTSEEWLDFVTVAASYDVPDVSEASAQLQRLWADVLQLAASLLANAPPGVKRRYVHSAGAIRGIAAAVGGKIEVNEAREQIEDIVSTLDSDPVLGVGLAPA